MEAQTSVAPALRDYIGTKDKFSDMSKQGLSLTFVAEDGNFNYLLKCTDGIFSGKFLYINTTPDGELFGSGDPDKVTYRRLAITFRLT